MKDQARILIADDENVVRLSYLKSLVGAGYKATAVNGGSQTLRLMEQQAFDVVFLDLRMPDLDGLFVLRAIKRHWPDSEVIIITGYPAIATAKEAVMLGAFHYLVKPVGPDEVVGAAKAALIHKGWALRTERSADRGVPFTERRAYLREYPATSARQGGTS